MVKKTVTFLDTEGKEITKDFYFNLTKMEVRTLDRKIPGGLENMIKEIRSEKDEARLVDLLDILILESYGEKGEDDRFIKEDSRGRRLSSYFKVSEAWDVLFMNLIKNENELTEFLTGIVPQDVANEALNAMKNGENGSAQAVLTPVT